MQYVPSFRRVLGAATLIFATLPALSTPAQPVGAAFSKPYADAFALMTEGNAYEGALVLVEALRQCPGDRAELAFDLVGPAQLLGFSIASLMDLEDHARLLMEVLDPKAHPTDELLIAVMHAGSGVQAWAGPAEFRLKQLADGTHQAVRVAALSVLASPYYFPKSAAREAAVAELLLAYPETDFSATLIEIPVYHAIDVARKNAANSHNLLEGVMLMGDRKARALDLSPGLARAAEALPSLDFKDIDDQTISAWSSILASESNPESRYLLVSILAKTCDTEARRAGARAGLEAIAQMATTTPDILRARMLLAQFAQQDHEPDQLNDLVTGMLSLGILPTTPERSMYEATLNVAQSAARYFTRHGWHERAARVHESLAAKYPGSALAKKELAKAAGIRENGLQSSLDLVALECDAALKNKDFEAVRAHYGDVMAHTPIPALRTALAERLRQMESEEERPH